MKKKNLIQILLSLCVNCETYNDDNNIYIKKNEKIICKTKFLKNKIDLLFPIYHKNLNINIDYEKIKGNDIILELKDDINIINIIETRLNV